MSYSFVLKNIVAVFTFISFSWAASCFFIVKDEGAKKGKKIISLLGLPSMLLVIYFLTQSEEISLEQDLVSSSLFIIASIIFWCSIHFSRKNNLSFAFSENKPSGVVKSGPYRFIRHPFYFSYTLAWFGGFIGTNNITILIICIVMFILYFKSAKFEENVILSSEFGTQYAEYKKATGMFFPKIIK